MKPEDYLSSHPLFGKGERSVLEVDIIDLEGRMSFIEQHIRDYPDDEDWKEYRTECYNKLKDLQHQWRQEHHLLSECQGKQLELMFD